VLSKESPGFPVFQFTLSGISLSPFRSCVRPRLCARRLDLMVMRPCFSYPSPEDFPFPPLLQVSLFLTPLLSATAHHGLFVPCFASWSDHSFSGLLDHLHLPLFCPFRFNRVGNVFSNRPFLSCSFFWVCFSFPRRLPINLLVLLWRGDVSLWLLRKCHR